MAQHSVAPRSQTAEETESPGQHSFDSNSVQKRKRERGSKDTASSRSTGTYARQKAPNACSVCRARKTKCDNELPICGFCKATGGECQYSKPVTLRYDQASLAILQRLDTLENNLTSLMKKSGDDEPTGSVSPTLSTVRTQLHGHDRSHKLVIQDLNTLTSPRTVVSQEDSGRTKAVNIESPPRSTTLCRASSEMSIEAMLRWPVFRQYFSQLSERPLSEYLSYPIGAFDGLHHEGPNLDPTVVYPLIENFIVNSLPSNPILDPVTLRQQVQRVVDGGLQWDGQTCLVLLVLALGSISSSTSQPRLDVTIYVAQDDVAFREAEAYFWASQLRIGTSYRETHLLNAQCAFFTAVYLSFTMRIMAAWKAFAQAGTHCLAHLTAKGLMDKSTDEIETRAPELHEIPEGRVLDDSLYWVILKGEAELCVELGLPGSGLHEVNYPHIFPCPPNLEKLVPSSGTMLEQLRESDRNHFVIGWFYYLGEIALKRLQNRVLQHLFSDVSEATGAAASEEETLRTVNDFDRQLDQWLQTLPGTLWFSATSTEYLHDHLRWVLRGHRLDIIELIRFPAMRCVLNADVTSPDGQMSLSPTTLRLAREYLDNAVLRIDVHVEEFLHRHQGTWLTIRGCTRSILALLGAKLKCQDSNGKVRFRGASTSPQSEESHERSLDDVLLPPRWRITVIRVLDMLRAWEHESRDLTRLRVVVETLLDICCE